MRALDWLDTGTPDALVTRVDFGPSEVNGFALARMAKLRRRCLPVIFVVRRQWEEHTADLGELLPVPLDRSELAKTLEHRLGTKLMVL